MKINHNTLRAHLCNCEDLRYRLLSTSKVYKTSQGHKIDEFISEIVELFKNNYVIPESLLDEIFSYLDLEIGDTSGYLKVEIINSSDLSDLQKSKLLKKLISLGVGGRAIDYFSYYRKIYNLHPLKSHYSFDPFRNIHNQIKIHPFKNPLETINLSPYNLMSFGHLAWLLYAIRLLEIGYTKSISIWGELDYAADFGALVSLIKRNYTSRIKIIGSINSNKIEDSNIALTDHFIHMKHSRLDLSHILINDKLQFASLCEDKSHSKRLIYHVRTDNYKNDSKSDEASFRNSSQEILPIAIHNSFPEYQIYDWEKNRINSSTAFFRRTMENIG